MDVISEETILAARHLIEAERGKLDILINNAGISGIVPQNAVDTCVEHYDEVFNIICMG